jgi:hypothetical protein
MTRAGITVRCAKMAAYERRVTCRATMKQLFPALPSMSCFADDRWMTETRPPPFFIADDLGLHFLNTFRVPVDTKVEWLSSRRARGRSKPRRQYADQRAETINCATKYPPGVIPAKLPATRARRKAAVMAYSMGSPQSKGGPSRARWLAVKIRPHQAAGRYVHLRPRARGAASNAELRTWERPPDPVRPPTNLTRKSGISDAFGTVTAYPGGYRSRIDSTIANGAGWASS